MVLPRRSGVALWRQVQIHLERQISDGSLQPGDQLPTEAQLAARFGVNRHTVRRALAGLEDRGLIRVEQGRGTFVQEPVLAYRVSVRTRFTDNVAAQNRVPTRSLVEVGEGPAGASVAAALDVAPQTRLTRIVIVGECDGHRISHGEHLFPAARFPGLAEAFRAEQSITLALRRLGVPDYHRKWTRVMARMPTGREADLLEQPRSRPVLVSESVNVDPEGRPIEYGLTRFNSDWVQIVFEP
ncbi:phosphonate metabolism transcriptional regulator PhnF [Roseospira goensis]|uniref:GntR family phosphonate transport system transcriptional regulator n=1 Tax=Roseospira goensis TaxID=391922 RepID=A0A7W6S161_9PROT|nr:phosphonate metabolism transcriptional regulator PhnF [Roseospira goensis]MBB4286998.1 GntR family phosphonate transport system transcriptional regulator [Roseospira goensis]